VSPRAFVPPPKITSSVVRVERLARPVAPANLAELERVTHASFGQRRKMLRQSLKNLSADAEDRIRAAGIEPTARPEQLSVTQFASLARAFAR
jgi:16S rRNA (adenine1518-N6/adenine1519-N6)-dimethyltransferase